jgi:hypothetical protein
VGPPCLRPGDLREEGRPAESNAELVHAFLEVIKGQIGLVEHFFLLSLHALELSNYFLQLNLAHR